jgi:hypothetical protein
MLDPSKQTKNFNRYILSIFKNLYIHSIQIKSIFLVYNKSLKYLAIVYI